MDKKPLREDAIHHKIKPRPALASLAFIVLVSGCGQGQLAESVAAIDTPEIGTVADNGNEVLVEFPVPDFATAINQTATTLDFESNLSLDQLVEFYRLEFGEQGLTETSAQVVQRWGGALVL